MPIQFIKTIFSGESGVEPRLVRIVCNDDYDTITAENYLLNASKAFPINSTDFIFIAYADNSFGIFYPILAPGAITLYPLFISSVTLPVVDNNLAAFDGTSGLIKDSGIAISNVQSKSNLIGQQLTWAGGSASHAFTITGLTTNSVVLPVLASAANSSEVITGFSLSANTVTINFSGDPGAVVIHVGVFIAAQ